MAGKVWITVDDELADALKVSMSVWRIILPRISIVTGKPRMPAIVVGDNSIELTGIVANIVSSAKDVNRGRIADRVRLHLNHHHTYEIDSADIEEWDDVMLNIEHKYNNHIHSHNINNERYHIKQNRGINVLRPDIEQQRLTREAEQGFTREAEQRLTREVEQRRQMLGDIPNSHGVCGLRGARIVNADMQRRATPWDGIKSDNEFNWNLPLTKDECYKTFKHKSGRVIPTISNEIEVSININRLNKRRKNG